MRSRLRVMAGLVMLLTLGCDQATKRVATLTLKGDTPRSFLADTLRLQYAENHGAFLSLGANWPAAWRFGLFALGNGLLLGLIAALLLRSSELKPSESLGFALVLAGGTSNLIDRLTGAGAVVDFLNVGLGGLRTGIFNVADMAITSGALVLLLGGVALRGVDSGPRT